jgi:chaperonin GroEL
MAKHITYDKEARRALERGFDLLTEAVAVALERKESNTVINREDSDFDY